MKKFRFRLEQVLQYRLSIKREKQRDLIREQLKLQEHLTLLSTLENELQNTGMGEGAIFLAQDVKVLGEYSERLRGRIAATLEDVESARLRVEEAQRIYQEAAKEAEALEKLKARKSEEFQAYVAKEEEKFLDELSVMRYEGKPKDGV